MTETRVKLPDGSYVSVPTDNPQQAAAAASRYWQGKQRPAAPTPKPQARTQGKPQAKPKGLWDRYKDFTDTAADAAGNMWDNIAPNWMDELYAAPRAAKALITGEDAGKAFRDAQAIYKRNQQTFAKDHPALRAASTGAGVVAGMAIPAGRALKGASMGRKMAQGAGVGLAYGAAAGAGKGEGLDLGTRGTNAVVDGAAGLAAGAVLPYGFDRLGAAGRWAREHVPGVDAVTQRVGQAADRLVGHAERRAPAAVQQARRMLGHHMNQGEIANGPGIPSRRATPQTIASEVRNRNDAGVPAIVGDVTPAMRDLTSWSSRGMGPGQSMVREALNARKAREAARVRQHVTETLPTTTDPIAYVEQAKREARDAAAPFYEQAYAQPMYRTPPIQAIEQTPAFRSALPQAHENIRNQIDPATGLPKDPQAMGFRYFEGDPNGLPPNVPHFALPERGYVALDNGLSTEGYDQVIRAMSDNGRAASHVNPVTGRVESTTNSVHINNRARDLRAEVMAQNAPYRQAVEGFGDDMSMVDGFNNGLDVGKLSGHEINAQARAMPDAAQGPWSTGAGTAMADEASRYGAQYPNGNTANHVRKMLGDDTKQAAISEMTGNTGGVRQLQDRLEYEHQGNLNFNEIAGNSRTAARQALDSDLNAAASDIPLTISGVKDKLLGAVVARMAPAYRNRVKEEVARVITASDARTVSEALAAIAAQAERDVRFADLLHKGSIGTTALYGSNLKPSSPDPDDNFNQP